MSGLLLVPAILAALIAIALRGRRHARLRRAARTRAGATMEQAIVIRSWAEIEDHLARRWCACGGYLERLGEGTREAGGRRFRVARLSCQECEQSEEVFFDTTDLLH